MFPEPALGLRHPCLGHAVVSRKAWLRPSVPSSQLECQHCLWSLQSLPPPASRCLRVTGLLTQCPRLQEGVIAVLSWGQVRRTHTSSDRPGNALAPYLSASHSP